MCLGEDWMARMAMMVRVEAEGVVVEVVVLVY